MSTPINRAAYLKSAGTPLEIRSAPIPTPEPDDIIVKNAAVAINPLDWHMRDSGVFVQQWPTIFGCDVAGTVHLVGSNVTRFKPGDRVIGHAINLTTGSPQDGAYQLYTAVPAKKTAILPFKISFTDGVVVPFALEAAICALCVTKEGVAMPGVPTPALGLPYPSLDDTKSGRMDENGKGKILVIYGGSSSVGSMATQVATAAGIQVIAISGAHNFSLVKQSGAVQVFDHKNASLVQAVIEAVIKSKREFVGIFDAISIPPTYAHSLAVLEKLGGGHLACVHPPPTENVPENVKVGMIFAVNDIATPIWENYVTPALEAGKLLCLPPPTVVGEGLEFVEEGLVKSKAGVSGTKLVVEL